MEAQELLKMIDDTFNEINKVILKTKLTKPKKRLLLFHNLCYYLEMKRILGYKAGLYKTALKLSFSGETVYRFKEFRKCWQSIDEMWNGIFMLLGSGGSDVKATSNRRSV